MTYSMKYLLQSLQTDGYERLAVMRRMSDQALLQVSFGEWDEYLDNGAPSVKRKPGDTLTGHLSVGLVCDSETVSRPLSHRQPVPQSPHVEAVVEIFQIMADDAVLAASSLQEEAILIAFESAVHYAVGERILIQGELKWNEDI